LKKEKEMIHVTRLDFDDAGAGRRLLTLTTDKGEELEFMALGIDISWEHRGRHLIVNRLLCEAKQTPVEC